MSWEIRKGDCMSHLAGMDSSSIDHVICDPPYDAKTHKGMRASDGVVQLGFDELSTMAHVREMLRVAKRWVIAFCSLEQLGQYALFAGDDHWIRAGFWDRVTGMPQISGDRPAQPGEGIAIMHAGKRKSWNGGGRHAIWRVARTNAEHHPTEKPVPLMEQLIHDFTDYGDTILDPFCGSGSTGVAAVRCGRNFIGIEMLDKYHDVAVKRLSGTHEQVEIAYRKRKKLKNLNLFGGNDGKETASEGQVEGDGSVAGDLLDPRRSEAGAQGEGEGAQDVDGGAVLRSDGDQVRPEDECAQGEAQQESDPFDEDEGPEVYGEEFGAEEDEGDPDAKGDAIRNGDFERGW